MKLPSLPANAKTRSRPGKLFSRFRKNKDGTTAIEFAMVATPFLAMMFGIFGLGFFFFTTFTLENAVEQAGRLIRTGQVDALNMSEANFKTKVCERLPVFVDCTQNLRVFVQSFPDNAQNLNPLSCLANGDLTGASAYNPGASDQIVLVTACYKWELPAKLPFLDLGNMGTSGDRLIQAVATFRNEPYKAGP